MSNLPNLNYKECMHHSSKYLNYYSRSHRSFHCQQCMNEIQSTPKEAEMNIMNVGDVAMLYQS